MSAFTEYDFAIRFRNVVRKIVGEILDQERPTDKVGRVVDIDRSAGIAYIVYAGDELNATKVKMYPAVQPPSSDRINGTGTGSIVRISGPIGGRYIAEILNDGAHQVNTRLFNPSMSSGGSGDSTLRSFFSFSTTGVPLADNNTWYPVINLLFPYGAGSVDLYTEMLGDGMSYMQHDVFAFDTSTALHSDFPTISREKSATDMYLESYFNLYEGPFDGFPEGTTALGISYLRQTTSTKNPTHMNVNLDCRGTDIQLISYNDGVY